jgi:hypothetical protein
VKGIEEEMGAKLVAQGLQAGFVSSFIKGEVSPANPHIATEAL